MEVCLSLGVLALGMLSLLAVTSPAIHRELTQLERVQLCQMSSLGPASHAGTFHPHAAWAFIICATEPLKSTVPGAWQAHPGLLRKGLPGTSSSSQHLGSQIWAREKIRWQNAESGLHVLSFYNSWASETKSHSIGVTGHVADLARKSVSP